MHAGGGKADDRIACGNVRARQQLAALGGADGKAGEVVVVVRVEAGHFRGLAADQRAAGLAAASAMPATTAAAISGVSLPVAK